MFGAAVELQAINGLPGVQHIEALSILRWDVYPSHAGQLHGSERASQAPRSHSKQPIAADTLPWNFDMRDLPQPPGASWLPTWSVLLSPISHGMLKGDIPHLALHLQAIKLGCRSV